MTTVADAELFTDAGRVKDQVVLITGGANGLGRSAAIFFGKHGAKVVIGDLDMAAAEAVVEEIKSFGSDAAAQKCDVTSWDQQLSLFRFAMHTFKRVDVVIPNAGVSELGRMSAARLEAVGELPTKPNMKTLDINLISVIYTARLGLYYLLENMKPGDLKSIVFMGSMSSFEAIPSGPLYTASKHAVIGLMGSLYGEYSDKIRFAVICPWFADTAIIPARVKLVMAGIPMTPISRVGGAIFKAATDSDPNTNGAVWTLPDDGPIFRLDRNQLHLNQGVFKLLNDRAAVALKLQSKVGRYYVTLRDLCGILGRKVLLLSLMIIVGPLAWKIKALWSRS